MNPFPQLERYTRYYTVTYRVPAPGYEPIGDGTLQPGEIHVEEFTGMNGPGGAAAFVAHCRAAGHTIINIGARLAPRE